MTYHQLAVISVGLLFTSIALLIALIDAKDSHRRFQKVTTDRLIDVEASRASLFNVSDRLAEIVKSYVKDCEEFAVLMNDKTPPTMAKELEALSIHEKLKQSRNDSVVAHKS